MATKNLDDAIYANNCKWIEYFSKKYKFKIIYDIPSGDLFDKTDQFLFRKFFEVYLPNAKNINIRFPHRTYNLRKRKR